MMGPVMFRINYCSW